MNIVLYRYNNICEPDIILSFERFGLNVIQIDEEIRDKKLAPSRRVQLISEAIESSSPLFVFSINYFPAIAETCHIYNVIYISWSVDSPVIEYFSNTIAYDTNRIFLFDRAQYEKYGRYNPSHIYHLPLAAACERFDTVVSSISSLDVQKYSHDISFIGSLYSERNPLHNTSFSEYTAGFISGLESAQLPIYE